MTGKDPLMSKTSFKNPLELLWGKMGRGGNAISKSGNMTYLCRVGDRDVGVFVVLDDIEESLFPCSGHFLEGGVLEVVHCEGYHQRRGIAVLVVCNVNLEMMMIFLEQGFS